MKKLLVLLIALLAMPVGASGTNDPYVDPMIHDALEADGYVTIMINLKGGKMPTNLPDDRRARGKLIAEVREMQYRGAREALMQHMGAENEDFQIIEEIPRSLKLVVRISDRQVLERLLRFSRMHSVHWADRKLTTEHNDAYIEHEPPATETSR